MKGIVDRINEETHWDTFACCCGHGKYPPSLIVLDSRVKGIFMPQDLFSGRQFPHGTRKFYQKDKHGYYHLVDSEVG